MAQDDGAQPTGDDGERAARKRRSRLGLFLPYILLAVIALAWSGGWFWVRAKAVSEIDAWLAREASHGREWTCADRSVTGFPFRLELRCASVKLARSDGSFTLGPLTALVQVYQPTHALFQATGPFHVEQGDLTGDVTWKSLEGSLQASTDGFTRASLVVEEPKGRVDGAEPGPIDFAMSHLELHARPNPGRFASDGAVDVSLRLQKGNFPQLDPLLGNAEPADAALDVTIDQATILRTRAVARELEAWRQADGKLEITTLSLVKGDKRIQAKGEIGLDDAHRPAGEIDVRAAGLGDIIGQIVGKRLNSRQGGLIGGLVGGLLGGMGRREPDPGQTGSANGGDPSLTPLPRLRLENGRITLDGPFPIVIPNVVLPSLY